MTAPELIEILSGMLEDGSILPHEKLLISMDLGETCTLVGVNISRFGPTLIGDEI